MDALCIGLLLTLLMLLLPFILGYDEKVEEQR